MPLFLRKFILDAVETGTASLLALTYFGDGESFAHAISIAIVSAIVSSARRNREGFLDWLRGGLELPQN